MVSKVGLKKVFAGFVAALALYAPVPSAGEQSAKTAAAQATDAARPALDYEFFKARVQPIFLKTRSEDHVRCYACHQVPRHPAGLHLGGSTEGVTPFFGPAALTTGFKIPTLCGCHLTC